MRLKPPASNSPNYGRVGHKRVFIIAACLVYPPVFSLSEGAVVNLECKVVNRPHWGALWYNKGKFPNGSLESPPIPILGSPPILGNDKNAIDNPRTRKYLPIL